jgi:hypothetical protein
LCHNLPFLYLRQGASIALRFQPNMAAAFLHPFADASPASAMITESGWAFSEAP